MLTEVFFINSILLTIRQHNPVIEGILEFNKTIATNVITIAKLNCKTQSHIITRSIMRVIELHQKDLMKQIRKLKDSKYDVKRNTRRPIIFRSDSKGRSLLPYLNHYNRINLIFRCRAKITSDFLQTYTLKAISRVANPVIILWFGTCELTIKRGQFFFWRKTWRKN